MSGCIVRMADGSDFVFPSVTLAEFVDVWKRDMSAGIIHMRGEVALNVNQIIAVRAN